MPNIAAVLKEEIRRLARSESRAMTRAIKKAASQHRRDIASLKREIASLNRRLSQVDKQVKKGASRKAASKPSEAEGLRFSAKGLKSHRAKLGLSAADYAKLVGVSALTVYNWEAGKSRPRAKQLVALAPVRQMGKREALKALGADEE